MHTFVMKHRMIKFRKMNYSRLYCDIKISNGLSYLFVMIICFNSIEEDLCKIYKWYTEQKVGKFRKVIFDF